MLCLTYWCPCNSFKLLFGFIIPKKAKTLYPCSWKAFFKALLFKDQKVVQICKIERCLIKYNLEEYFNDDFQRKVANYDS